MSLINSKYLLEIGIIFSRVVIQSIFSFYILEVPEEIACTSQASEDYVSTTDLRKKRQKVVVEIVYPRKKVVDTKLSQIDLDRLRNAHPKRLDDYILPGCFLVPGASKKATQFFDCNNNDILHMLRSIRGRAPDILDETLVRFSSFPGISYLRFVGLAIYVCVCVF